MKRLAAITFSLLLIVAQTLAGRATVSGGIPVAKAGCCGDERCSCVQPSDTPVSVPSEAVLPGFCHQASILPPALRVCSLALTACMLAPAGFSAARSEESVPLFLLNRALLI